MTYKVVSKGKVYWYAYRGGPRIADPSTAEGAERILRQAYMPRHAAVLRMERHKESKQ